MIAALIRWSVKSRFFVLLGALALIVVGGLSVRSTSIDALPDLSGSRPSSWCNFSDGLRA